MVVISKRKAKRLGISETDRKSGDLTKRQLTDIETKSGQYDIKDGKTMSKANIARREAEKEVPQETKVTTLPTIRAEREKPTVLGAIKQKLGETTILPGIKVQVPLGIKAGLAASIPLAFVGGGGALATAGTTMTRSVGGTITGKVATNPKTIAATTGILSKFFSAKTLGILGGAAGAMFLGQWGQAEAGEPISIAMRDALRQAEATGDWTVYDEAAAARDEIINLATWEKIALWTPIAPLIGIQNKIKGTIAGARVLDAIADNNKIAQETGETEDAKWDRIREQQAEDETENIDYYNQERKKMVDWEREAEKDARNEDAAFWRKEKEKQSKLEAADRKAIADFWLAYRKQSQKLAEDNRPSNLNFGLL